MTRKEAIDRIKTPLNHGVESDDSTLKDRYIYSLLKTNRAKILRQRLNDGKYISSFNYTTIACLPLEHGKFSDCPCFTDDCYILRSKDVIPPIVSSIVGDELKVYTIQGVKIDPTSKVKSDHNQYRKTNQEQIGYFIYNNRLYITGTTELKVVTVSAIFSDPMDVEGINACDTEGNEIGSCYDSLKDDFPIDDELFDMVESLIFDKLKEYKSNPQDNENNAKDIETVNHIE